MMRINIQVEANSLLRIKSSSGCLR